jgi:hypothetical protein
LRNGNAAGTIAGLAGGADFALAHPGGIMKIPRLNVITLGVADLGTATKFYQAILDTPANTSYEGVTFFELPGTWISLFPLSELARDISPSVRAVRGDFSGITLAHNARSKDEVVALIERARLAGARIMKEPRETFWGGFSGYFTDPDGYCWEIVWGPMFEFSEQGELRFKKSAEMT